MAKNTRLWQMSDKQYRMHIERKFARNLRKGGCTVTSPWSTRYHRTFSYWQRPDKVKDPKTAFLYLLDNVAGQNSGKFLSHRSSRGDYHWIERDRNSTDQSYFIVRKRGNYVIVTRQRWLVNGQGVNTFVGSLTGFDEEPNMVKELILRHPIMKYETFKRAYAAVAPSLDIWED